MIYKRLDPKKPAYTITGSGGGGGTGDDCTYGCLGVDGGVSSNGNAGCDGSVDGGICGGYGGVDGNGGGNENGNANFSFGTNGSFSTIENMTDDYVLGVNTFNITAELNNSCRGGIHYPVGILLDYNHTGVISSPGSGVVNYGDFAYMIFENTSTTIQWGFTINYTMMANETDEGYSGSCPLSHPYPSDPAGAGDDNYQDGNR